MEKPDTIRVISAIADKTQVILYLEDGNTLVIKQGDHRLADLLNIIIPITIRGEVAVVNLHDFSIYAALEKRTNGMVKFFRIAKSLVTGWFKGETQDYKNIISDETKSAVLDALAGTTITAEEVVEYGEPIEVDDKVEENEIVVALVTTPATDTQPEKKTVIPGVDSIKPLIDHAVRSNSTEAVQNFLTRCAKFIDKRQHSVEDLLRFLEKGDLPLAEDGSIIAYKMLRYHKDKQDVFQDCHTGRVIQRVGSYVCVNEELVDLSRHNQCADGLHIARRGYLGGFSGDVCVLCKVDPEDVMVVPSSDPDKVRVKGYHILAVMSDEAMVRLKQNKPMTGETDALEIVYRAIKGDHIDRIERVQINGQLGTDIKVTKLKHNKHREQNTSNLATAADLKNAAAIDDEVNIAGSVDPREINKRITTEKENLKKNPVKVVPEPKTGTKEKKAEVSEPVSPPLKGKRTQAEQARFLYDTWCKSGKKDDLSALVIFKRKTKRSWETLNFSIEEVATIITRRPDGYKNRTSN